MKLSSNFILKEFTDSEKAVELGIENIPDNTAVSNLLELVQNVLQPLRHILKKPIEISSGFRCKELNTEVGGEDTSQHTKGEAADITVEGMTPREVFESIRKYILEFDQLIEEPSWVHVSYRKGRNRKQMLRAQPIGTVNGKTKYAYHKVV